MASRHGDKRMNVEDDRLSSLPDCLIHKILSFISIKHAIQTSVLSSRWRFIWTSMPCLSLSRDDFSRLPKFSEFVTHVLSDRNNQTEVSSVTLRLHGEDTDAFDKQTYAFSHNIQTLNVASLIENDVEIPLSLFSSQSLKHLSLTMEFSAARAYRTMKNFSYVFKATSTWELPALTTLYIHYATLCCDENTDLFSKCANLKNLTLIGCNTKGFKVLSICLPLLSNLKLNQSACGSVEVIKIDAPQLKNLNITDCQYKKYLISAPNLVVLLYKGYHSLQLVANDIFLWIRRIFVYPIQNVLIKFYVCFNNFKMSSFLHLAWKL